MGLQNAFPRMPKVDGRRLPLISIPGGLPNLLHPPPGCRFARRCPFATERCHREDPILPPDDGTHVAACHHSHRAAEFRAAAVKPETWKARGELA
jgi:oligopeptide/dipeptide ABC transporter ATP-binding protein